MSEVRYIVDRVEGEIAVCERDDLKFFDISLVELPQDVKAGDCLVLSDGVWSVDVDETATRRQRIGKKMRDLFI